MSTMLRNPLFFPCVLDSNQLDCISLIIKRLESNYEVYLSISESNRNLSPISFNSITEDLYSVLNLKKLQSKRYLSYSLQLSLIKFEYILSVSKSMVSMDSALIDSVCKDSIIVLSRIIQETYDDYIDSDSIG